MADPRHGDEGGHERVRVGGEELVSMKMERIPRSVLALPAGARPRSMTQMMMGGGRDTGRRPDARENHSSGSGGSGLSGLLNELLGN